MEPAISVYSMAISYCDEARAVRGWCAQLSSYAESEIASLVPQVQLAIVAVRSARDGKLHGWEPGNKTTHSVPNVNQNPACLPKYPGI